VRSTFVDELCKATRAGRDTILMIGDLGFSVVEPFQEEFPERFYNLGVAEQNMAGAAAGMASEGFQVFCYSIGNFNTFRCAEQIRNDIDYQELPVCTVSVGGGVSYGSLGYSHHAIQDYALMRTMPNTVICAPADPLETRLCIQLILERGQPSYLRLHKSGEPVITMDSSPITPGVPRLLFGNPQASVVILSTGFMAHAALRLAQSREDVACYTLPCWGMRFRDSIPDLVRSRDRVITVEDHLVDGGFGSWVLECLAGTPGAGLVTPLGLTADVVGLVGREDYIHEAAGLRDLDPGLLGG